MNLHKHSSAIYNLIANQKASQSFYKRMLLVSIITFLHFNKANATSCSGCTYTISTSVSTNYTLTSGQKLCITSSGTITGSVTLSGGTICNEGTFTPSSFTYSSGTFDNYLTAILPGAVSLSGTLTFTNYSGATITMNSTFASSNPAASFINHGTATVSGTFTGSGGSVTNDGTLTINGLTSLSGGTFANSGTVNSTGITISGNTFSNSSAGTITNTGNLTNSGTLGSNAGIITNTGNFNNNGGTFTLIGGKISSVNFTNHGTIAGPTSGGGCGVISATTTTTNTATISNYADICDATPPGGAIKIDVNSGTVGGNVTYCTCCVLNTPTITGTTSVCNGISTTLTASSGTSYSWSTSATTQAITVSPATTTTYTVTVTYTNGCTRTKTQTVTVTNPSASSPSAISSGDLVWSGNVSADWSVAGNWLSYNGSVFSVASAKPSSSTNVFIRNYGSCVTNNPQVQTTPESAKNITIDNGSTLTVNSTNTLQVYGNFTNNGTFTANSSTVKFLGTAAQTLSGTTASTFYNLTINNSKSPVSSATITVGIAPTVTNQLTLTRGFVVTTGYSLNMTAGSSVPGGASDTSFVSGPMKKTGNTSFVFPVGKGTKHSDLSITAPATVTDAFTAEYFNSNQPYAPTQDTGITSLSACEYWTLDRTTGTDNVSVTFGWNTLSCNVASNISSMRVAVFNTAVGKWKNKGGINPTGNTTSGTITSSSVLTTYGALTLAQDAPTGIIATQNSFLTLISLGYRNFDSIVNLTAAFNDAHPELEEADEIFERWKANTLPQLNSSGYLQNYSEIVDNEFNSWLNNNALSCPSSNWQFAGPVATGGLANINGIGRLNCIAFDPNYNGTSNKIIYVGTPAGGVWRTTDGGTTWVPLLDLVASIGVSGIAIDPNTTTTIYILTGDPYMSNTQSIGILKSTNNGATWTKTGLTINQTTTGLYGEKLVFYPGSSSILYAGMFGGLYKSTNSGTSWTKTITGHITDIEFNPANPAIMYASTYDGYFYRSTDAGSTWTQITNGLPAPSSLSNGGYSRIAVTPANSNYVYMIFGAVRPPFQVDFFQGLYRSTDGGLNFSFVSDYPNLFSASSTGLNNGYNVTYYAMGLAVSPTNADELYTGTLFAWKSTNGGVSWTNTTISSTNFPRSSPTNYVHVDFHDLAYDPTGVIFCANDGGLNKSTNNGTHWTDLSAGLPISQVEFLGLDPAVSSSTHMLIGTQDNGTYHLQSTGSNSLPFGGDGENCFFDPSANPAGIYYTSQQGSVYRSLNNGTSANSITPITSQLADWTSPIFIDPGTSGDIFACRADLFKLTDKAAATWTNISNGNIGTGTTSTQKINIAKIAPSNPNYFYVHKLDGLLFKSTNAGVNWSSILPSSFFLKTFTISETDEQKIWIAGTNFSAIPKVYYSPDAGVTWIDKTLSGLPNIAPSSMVHLNGSPVDRIFLGLGVGIYYLDNNACSWVPYFCGAPYVNIKDLEIDYVSNKLVAGTFGRGVWSSPLPSNSSGGAASISNTHPSICLGANTQLTAIVSTGSSPFTYSWSNSVTTSTQNFVSTSAGTITFTVTVTDSKGCTSTSNTSVTVSSSTAPVADAGSAITVYGDACTGSGFPHTGTVGTSAIGSNTYSWSPSGGLSSTTVAQPTVSFYGPTGTFTYTVTVTATNGCTNTSQVLIGFGNCSGTKLRQVEETPKIIPLAPVAENRIKFYPNPASDILTIEYELVENAIMEIQNILGEKVDLYNLTKGVSKAEISLISIPKGLYLCKVYSLDKLISTSQLVIIR